MKHCAQHLALKQWAHKGSSAVTLGKLNDHANGCNICRTYLREVRQARELGQQLPNFTLSRNRHETVKFNLMAEARRNRYPTTHRRRHLNLRVRLLSIAAIVGGAAAAATATPWGTNERAQSFSMLTTLESHIATPFRTPRRVDNAFATTALPAVLQPKRLHPNKPGPSTFFTDSAFAIAWNALQAGQPAAAAARFDDLLYSENVDDGRRADILYWSAQSHRQSGNIIGAIKRSTQLLRKHPTSPFAPDAALMLGEYALADGKLLLAKLYLRRAAQATHCVVRERAIRELGRLK